MEKKLLPIMPFLPRAGREQKYIAYLDEIRAQYGSTIYPIDRFVEVFKIRDNVWAMYAPCTHPVEDNWVYLIEGPEKALTIDNGYGIGDLKGLCEMLVNGKEVLTAVTHNHLDHSGGSVQWDKVYCHKYCADNMMRRLDNYEEEWKRFNHYNDPEKGRRYYTDADIWPFNHYECVAMEDHDVINLGGDYDIELIHMGGHAPGEACFLDKKGRILYTGDAMFETSLERTPTLSQGAHGSKPRPGKPQPLHPEFMSPRYFAKCVTELAKRIDEWDSCAAGHGYFDSPATLVSDMVEVMNVLLDNPHNYSATMMDRSGQIYIIQRGDGAIHYNDPDTILD